MARFHVSQLMGFVCLAIGLSVAATARGQQYDFAFSVGYSNLQLDNPNNLLLSKDGAYFDMDLAFKVPQTSLPVMVGVGFTGSGYFDSQDTQFRLSSTTIGTATLYSNLGFFSIEPRIALAFYSQPRQMGLFLRPRIGVGLLIDSYGIDHITQNAFSTTFQTLHHTGVAVEVRPSIQAGYSWGPGEFGVEASYMAAWGDFGDFGSEAQEFRIGPFFSYRF